METEDIARSNREVDYIFVYGTLRKDVGHTMSQVLAKYAHFAGAATFQGKLFDLGSYPGTVPSDDLRDAVRGEVYALEPLDRDDVLTILDEYEGYNPEDQDSSEFRREHLTITFDDGRRAPAWIYLYNLAEVGAPIPLGDYARYLKEKGVSPLLATPARRS